MTPVTTATTIHIFVELSKNEQKEIEFNTDRVTGLEIKQRAGVPSDYDLARREGQKLIPVPNPETIEIKNGEHFVALPPGTVS